MPNGGGPTYVYRSDQPFYLQNEPTPEHTSDEEDTRAYKHGYWSEKLRVWAADWLLLFAHNWTNVSPRSKVLGDQLYLRMLLVFIIHVEEPRSQPLPPQ